MKRFYKEVTVTDECGLLLDGRPVRTPARAPLILPNARLASQVAAEWANQGDEILPQTMPLTGLANAAIDRVAPEHGAFAARMAAYGETELLCYRAESPPDLIARHWARSRYDVDFTLVEGVMHRPQPMATVLRLGAAVAAASADQLAALSPLVTISGSLVISLALMEEAVLPGDAFDLAHLDELWQAELWGEDDWALDARDARRRDFLAACHFLELLRA
jgi:chaperone required for assembly of F1-ATPase